MKQTNLEWLLTLDVSERPNEFDRMQNKFSEGYRSCEEDTLLFIDWLASPHIEPITLTAEERHAAELAVVIGLPWIKHAKVSGYDNTLIAINSDGANSYGICDMPSVKILHKSTWITNDYIDLRELLKEGSI